VAADAPVIVALFQEHERSAAALGYDLGFQGFADEVANLPGKYARPQGLMLIAWSGGETVGRAAYRPLLDQICEMKRLYLRPAFAGTGLGSGFAGN
jgi:putative acetyltransferase